MPFKCFGLVCHDPNVAQQQQQQEQHQQQLSK